MYPDRYRVVSETKFVETANVTRDDSAVDPGPLVLWPQLRLPSTLCTFRGSYVRKHLNYSH